MRGSANNDSLSSEAPLRLYLVYRWGNDHDGDGPNGDDTNYIVRARTQTKAVELVDPLYKAENPKEVSDRAHGVIELGTSFDPGVPESEHEQVLRGPFFSGVYHCNEGLPHWGRVDGDEGPLLASCCTQCGHYPRLGEDATNCPDCGRSRLEPAHYPIATPRRETCVRWPGEAPLKPVVCVDGYFLLELFCISEQDHRVGALSLLHSNTIRPLTYVEEIYTRGASGIQAIGNCHPLAVNSEEIRTEPWCYGLGDKAFVMSYVMEDIRKIGKYPQWRLETLEGHRVWQFLGPCPMCKYVSESSASGVSKWCSWCPKCAWSRPPWINDEATLIECA